MADVTIRTLKDGSPYKSKAGQTWWMAVVPRSTSPRTRFTSAAAANRPTSRSADGTHKKVGFKAEEPAR